jgi:predicted enzyme related to lactoylglutathione lyase
MDFKLELVIVPVTDVDRAKAFYVEQAGWNLDVDMNVGGGMRVVQLTPPGSPCSVGIGTGITDAAPGSYRGIYLVVTDIVAAREELLARGVQVSDVRHIQDGEWRSGPAPGRGNYESYADFADPDGNTWMLQERDHPTTT